MINCKQQGFNFIELIIAMALASIMASGALGLFIKQGASIRTSAQKDELIVQTHALHDRLTTLLKQAEQDSISIDNTTLLNDNQQLQKDNDAFSVSLRLPQGYAIWPNNRAAPGFEARFIQIGWSLNGNTELDANTLGIKNAASMTTLGQLAYNPISSDQHQMPVLTNVELWPVNANGTPMAQASASAQSYLLRISARAFAEDRDYTNPLDPQGPLKHFRSYTVAGIVTPRN